MNASAQDLFRFPAEGETVWVSFENPRGERGAGGRENRGAKGHPAEDIAPGETKVLLDFAGAGVIHRIWLTVSERSPVALRSLRLEMTWDGASRPAVAAPLGDFFGIGLGRRTPFENALFSDPEGRSFNGAIPMPFRTAARITLTNESAKPVTLFYDVNLTRVTQPHADDVLYFHAHWNHNGGTKLGEDFEILPAVRGRGRYLGCNLGIVTDPSYGTSWFGEGEVKVYLDDDGALPSLVGTGTEDYIGTAWGQAFVHRFQGCPIADAPNRQWAFYRYHLPDPVYFRTGCRVTIQQMGGDMSDKVKQYAAAGAQLRPVTVSTAQGMVKLLELPAPPKLSDAAFPSGWTNFHRLDDYTATAYFYLDAPASDLPPLAPLDVRLRGVLAQ